MPTTSFSATVANTTGQALGYVQSDGFYSPIVLGIPSGTATLHSLGPAQFPYGVGAGAQVGPNTALNTSAATAGFTMTAANITGGSTVNLTLTGTLGAGANIQLPTVAALIAALPGANTSTSYTLRIVNQSSANFAWTVTTNAGSGTWTLTGTMSIAQNTWREFVVQITNVTAGSLAATITSVAVGTYS